MKKKRYTKAIGLLVSNEMYGRIMEICDEQEIGISEFIREALNFRLEQLLEDEDILTEY